MTELPFKLLICSQFWDSLCERERRRWLNEGIIERLWGEAEREKRMAVVKGTIGKRGVFLKSLIIDWSQGCRERKPVKRV